MNTALEASARNAGIMLAGSVIAVPADQRDSLTGRLLDARHWVHADMIEGRYLGQEGVTIEEIIRLAELAGPRLDAHLMVDNMVETISHLPQDIGRITIQYPAVDAIEEAMAHARPKARSVWIALDSPSTSVLSRALACGPDGLLAMLTPPGQAGHAADLRRLDPIKNAAGTKVPFGVDGGVNEENFKLLQEAGVTYAVAGRALVRAARPSTSSHRPINKAKP
ncbi:ribulose-phosphate 3-epimerase [Paenarthrobacter histidinolovorans]|nr:ribulose-phosphate 3-epimerase [Paenarthrobacter histidinolovorans]